VSGRDKKEARGRAAGRQSSAYPRVAASLSVNLAAEDCRTGAALRSGAIGGCPPLEPSRQRAQRRSPGELGAADEPRAKAPRPPRKAAASAAGDESQIAIPASSGNGAGGADRRKLVATLPAAPLAGAAGLPGLSVFLGELGSPAKGEAAAPAARPTALLLARGLRAVPSLADVSVTIGGDPARGRGSSRLVAPFRALLGKRSSRVETRPPTTAAPARRPAAQSAPAEPSAAPAMAAPERPVAESPLRGTAVPSRPSRLRRASRYIVNGILDVTIRRFRATVARGGNPRRG
jgi:hypothetical protein